MSHWVMFEAGALAQSIGPEEGRVTALVLGVKPSDIPAPLALFQATHPTEDEIRRLVHSINACTSEPVQTQLLDRTFDKYWPDLVPHIEAALREAAEADDANHGVADDAKGSAPKDDAIELLLELTRQNQRDLQQIAASGLRTQAEKTAMERFLERQSGEHMTMAESRRRALESVVGHALAGEPGVVSWKIDTEAMSVYVRMSGAYNLRPPALSALSDAGFTSVVASPADDLALGRTIELGDAR